MQASLGARISDLGRAWRVLGSEQRVAAAGAVLLIVSTFGNFTFVEAAEVLTALGVLLLLKRRADGYDFHLPFGDGTAIAAAGAWCVVLILIRLFDRPLGQSGLALCCAVLILGAGIRERAKRPMDDLPDETLKIPRDVMAREDDPPTTQRRRAQPDPGAPPAPPRRQRPPQ
jgi:hypothetical protein